MGYIVNLARTSLSLALIVASSAVSADECVPSPWGADDQIGAANRVTPERTAAAAKLVKKKGLVTPLVSLSNQACQPIHLAIPNSRLFNQTISSTRT